LWYPQAENDDFATATLEAELPPGYAIVAPGRRTVTPLELGGTLTRYDIEQPVKHIVFAVGRLVEAGRREESGVTLTAFASARLRGDAARMLDMAAQILKLFVTEFGPCPYPNLQLVFMEAANPGGHSPPGLAIVVRRPLSLRAVLDDPANFVDVPGFFLAHELSHQWWGDGVTGRSYHDRWISEAMSQYAAARWVQESQGEDEFREVMSDMARWALRESDAGPIFLGHRIGHLENDSKLFRAVVYDKGAWVLHMLRGIVGADAFRTGLRAYQQKYRFQKAGTPQLREVLSEVGGRDLTPYFESWIYGTELPALAFTSETKGSPHGYRTTVTVRTKELPGPVPVTITLQEAGEGEERVETLKPAGGQWIYVTPRPPRKVQVNADQRILARRYD
jgi:aminopeptidase N